MSLRDRLRPPRSVRRAARSLDPSKVLTGEVSTGEYFGVDLNPGDFKSVTDNADEKAKEYSNSERENKNYSNCVAVVSVECANDSSIFDGTGIEGIMADGGIAVAKIACGRIYKSEPSG
ncbi:hypothetical protein F6Y04_06405 [Bacillus megaterium]|nr:hypothetical protein [Priestia megaterium]NGY70287.1 hypothetical protein [Priestia megaterium]